MRRTLIFTLLTRASSNVSRAFTCLSTQVWHYDIWSTFVPQLNLGYNVVAHIPKGACNLNITEIRKSPNHLALRKLDGTFIFNGDYHHISWPGVYDGVGTQFQYTRNDLKSLESIVSAGPLKEPVDVILVRLLMESYANLDRMKYARKTEYL